MIYLSALVFSMFTTIALIPLLKDFSGKYLAIDYPGERKIHQHPIPKSGGIAMVLAGLVPILLWTPRDPFFRSLLIGSWIIILFGFLDDMKDLPYGIKFIGQLVAGLIVVFYGGLQIKSIGALVPGQFQLPAGLAIPITMIVIVGVTNAINLSDGLDGLAGGISLLVFICIAYLAYLDGNRGVVVVCSTMIGAILGFLRFNTHPASIFMGDAGSQLLGFLAITLSLQLTQKNLKLAPILPLLIMGLPIMDTLRVMGERLLNGHTPFKADTRHLHHRLMKIGLFHSEAVLAIYCLHAAMVTFAFLFRYHSDLFLILSYMAFSITLILSLSWFEGIGWRREQNGFWGKLIKTNLKLMKNSSIIIVLFKLLEFGAPLLLIISCFISSSIPFFLALISAGLGCLLVAVLILKPEWTGIGLKLALYMQVPLIIYQGELYPAKWIGSRLLHGFDFLFVLMAFAILLVLKFTRRKSGFKSTPMDFLILFIALVIPNIPDVQIRSYQMGMIAAKIICLYFGYEVIIGELRGDYRRLSYATILILVVISSRGLLSI